MAPFVEWIDCHLWTTAHFKRGQCEKYISILKIQKPSVPPLHLVCPRGICNSYVKLMKMYIGQVTLRFLFYIPIHTEFKVYRENIDCIFYSLNYPSNRVL